MKCSKQREKRKMNTISYGSPPKPTSTPACHLGNKSQSINSLMITVLLWPPSHFGKQRLNATEPQSQGHNYHLSWSPRYRLRYGVLSPWRGCFSSPHKSGVPLLSLQSLEGPTTEYKMIVGGHSNTSFITQPSQRVKHKQALTPH